MIDITDIVRVALSSYSDWARGGGGKWTRRVIPFVSHKHIWLFILANLYCNVIGYTWFSIIFIVWFTIGGVAFGTGDPVGKIVIGHSNHGNDNNKAGKWEKWQYIFKTDNAYTNHAILGGLWSLGATPLVFIDIAWLFVFISHVIGFYISGFVVQIFPKNKQWQALEITRSGLTMLLTIIMVGVIHGT